MRAVIAAPSTPRYLWTAAAGRVRKDAGWGPGGIFQLRDDVPRPALPSGSGWVRVRPELSGVCGSDLGLAHAKISFVLSALYQSSRMVPGHEIVGVVSEAGPDATVSPGDRVVINPLLSCAHRGFAPHCAQCRADRPHLCERSDQPGDIGCLAPAIGFVEPLGGGWGEELVVHDSQCYPVGDIPSHRAVLAEPASIGLHAALRWQRDGDRVVVIGPGTIGLLVTAALRRLHPHLHITVISPGAFGDERAHEVGADRTLAPGRGAVEAIAEQDGGRVLRPRMTRVPVLEQGVDAVFDCVGSPETIDLATHLLRPRGTLVLIGAAGRQSADWSLVWHRELQVRGAAFYAPEPDLGRTTFAEVVEWLGDTAYPVDGLVTHRFDLADWTEALGTASAGPAAGAVKVTLRPDSSVPLVGNAPHTDQGPN